MLLLNWWENKFNELTWVKINISSDTGSNESHSQWPCHGHLVIKHLKLIQMRMTKKLSSNCAFIPVFKRKRKNRCQNKPPSIKILWHGFAEKTSLITTLKSMKWHPVILSILQIPRLAFKTNWCHKSCSQARFWKFNFQWAQRKCTLLVVNGNSSAHVIQHSEAQTFNCRITKKKNQHHFD